MKKIILSVFAITLVATLLMPAVALADDPWQQGNEYLEEFQQGSGYGDASLPTAIGKIMNVVLGFLGLLATILIIIGGFQWMMSGGSDEKIGAAKKLMMAGVIGLIIVILAYAVGTFIVSRLSTITE